MTDNTFSRCQLALVPGVGRRRILLTVYDQFLIWCWVENCWYNYISNDKTRKNLLLFLYLIFRPGQPTTSWTVTVLTTTVP